MHVDCRSVHKWTGAALYTHQLTGYMHRFMYRQNYMQPGPSIQLQAGQQHFCVRCSLCLYWNTSGFCTNTTKWTGQQRVCLFKPVESFLNTIFRTRSASDLCWFDWKCWKQLSIGGVQHFQNCIYQFRCRANDRFVFHFFSFYFSKHFSCASTFNSFGM